MLRILLLSLFLFEASVFASQLTSEGNQTACPEGLWDLGAGRAALMISCAGDQSAELRFCRREVILEGRPCYHVGSPVACDLQEDQWRCLDEKDGFEAVIHWIGQERIQYQFQSRFNSGILEGSRF